MRYLLVILLTFSLLPACESERQVSAELSLVSSCAEVEDRIRQSALEKMNTRLYQIYLSYLDAGDWCWGYGDRDDGDLANGAGSGAPPPPSDEGGASDYSETNNQVAGVDEADFIKNDGNYIYLVSDGAFRIIDAWPAPEAHVIAEVPIEGTPKKLFVYEDRALVYSSLEEGSTDDDYWWQPRECTYGYSCSFTGDGHPTKITVLEIEEPDEPEVEREIYLSGSYVNARRIGKAVHTIISDPGPTFEGLAYYPENLDYCGDNSQREILRAFARLQAQNTRLIMEAEMSDWLPQMRDVVHTAAGTTTDTDLVGACETFYTSDMEDGAAITSVLSLDMTDDGDDDDDDAPALASIVSSPGAIYGSQNALYMAVPHQHNADYGWYPEMNGVEEASSVHKFELTDDPPAATYRGSGVVEGRVLNQFSMDEYEDNLRIATTTGRVPDPNVHSTLTVLRDVGGELVATGAINGIAPTEDIRSVRFDGPRGFIVTFKKTDPLFLLDLGNPSAPQILAELKIPGFSTYMHLMDEDHLLTIGYDADDQGSFAWFTGVMLQIFDISDMAAPALAHKEIIGTRGSSSEALTNHLAFNYYAPRDLLALPMTVCEESSGGGSYGDEMTFSGLMVYDVTTETGFDLHGLVDHPVGDEISCYNWWTNATSQVKRSVFMEEYVFSISETLVKVNHLDDLSEDLVLIPIAGP